MNDTKRDNIDLDNINKKIKSVYNKKKGFTKLPLFESLLNKQEEKKEQNIENEKVETEGFTSNYKQDFADRELIEELQNMGFIPCTGESSNESNNSSRQDRWCKDSYGSGDKVQIKGDESMQIYSIIKIQGNVVALAPVMNNDAENKITTTDKIQKIKFMGNPFTIATSILYLPFVLISYLMKKSSILFSDIVTFKKVEEKDQRLLYSEFQTLINSFFILFITYNWLFIWCYKDENDIGIETPKWDTDWLENKYGGIIKYFFENPLFPTSILNIFFTSKSDTHFSIPNILNGFKSPIFQWFLSFIVIYTLFDFGSSWVKGLSQSKDSTYIIMILLLWAIFAGTRMPTREEFERDLKLWKSYIFFRWLFKAIVSWGLYMFICLFMFVYMIYYSLFGLTIPGIGNISETYKKLIKYLNSEEEEETNCIDSYECKSNWDKIIYLIKYFLNHIFDFIIIIIAIMNMLKSLTVFNMKLESDRLKSVMNIFIPIGIVVLILIQVLVFEEKNEFSDISNPSPYDDYLDLPEDGITTLDDNLLLRKIEQKLNNGDNETEIKIDEKHGSID